MGNWATKKTGGVGEFVGTIDRAEFITSEDYHDPNRAILEFLLGGVTDEAGHMPDEWHISYSADGVSEWQIVEGGQAVESQVDPSDTLPGETSKWGLLVEQLLTIDGVAEVLEDRGDPTDAASYEGLRFAWEETTHDYGGDIGEVDITLPVKFLGVEDDVGGDTEVSSNGAGSNEDREKLERKLTALAKKADNHDEFQDKALDIDDVVNDDELFDAVVDPSDDGFYAQAVSA